MRVGRALGCVCVRAGEASGQARDDVLHWRDPLRALLSSAVADEGGADMPKANHLKRRIVL